MSDQYVSNTSNLAGSGTGAKVDVAELTVNTQVVERQRMVIGDNTTAANYLAVDSTGHASVDLTEIETTGSFTAAAQTLSLPKGLHYVVALSGTWVGTVIAEYSRDGGTNWIADDAYDNGWTTAGRTTNGIDLFGWGGSGSFQYRLRCSAYTSGTIAVRVISSKLPKFNEVNSYSSTIAIADYNTPVNKLLINASGQAAIAPLVAGTAIAGKFGIDQTTIGTTNAVSLAQIGATTIVTGGVAGTQAVGGITAVNAATTGNPVYSGGVALVAANPTAATNAQRTGFATDKVGRQIVVNNHERGMTAVQQTTFTANTAETTIVTAGAAGVFNDLTQLTITNGGAAATIATLKDATAGTTRAIYNLSIGGGVVVPFPTPLAQAAAASNWTLTLGTSTSSVYVVAQYVKNI